MLPTDIKLHKKTGILELCYPDGTYSLSAEFLRVHSPSAEVRGHGQGQEVLQFGKKNVKISTLDSVGNYAIRLHFDDDHNTGIYTWEYLRQLSLQQDAMWQAYLQKLEKAGKRRDNLPPDTQVLHFVPNPKK
jgi:DUF971 family protein